MEQQEKSKQQQAITTFKSYGSTDNTAKATLKSYGITEKSGRIKGQKGKTNI